MNVSYPFTLPPLPYRYNALEPNIGRMTMRIHHDILFQRYIDRLNAALKPYPQYHNWGLERLVLENDRLPREIQLTVFNNAGGVYNHTLYFNSMTPCYQQPSQRMTNKINEAFGSFDQFKAEMSAAGNAVFGSGWAWLVIDHRNHLKIVTTPNQNTPLTNHEYPILPLDVWEHAYFLQYYADRADYIDHWFELINWDYVEKLCCHKIGPSFQ